MTKPFASLEEYKTALLSLGNMLAESASRKDILREYESLLRAEEETGAVSFPFARLREVFSLSQAQAMCVLLWLYKVLCTAALPTVEELHACRLRFGGGSLPAQLFVSSGSMVDLHPVAADFLLERYPRLPAGVALNPCRPESLFRTEALLEEMERFSLSVLQQELASAAIVLRGEAKSGRRFLFSQLAARLGTGMLEIDPTPEAFMAQEDILLACLLYDAVPCLLRSGKAGRLLEQLSGAVRLLFIRLEAGEQGPPAGLAEAVLVRELPPLTAQEQLAAMRHSFLGMLPEWDAYLPQFAAIYRMTPGRIQEAAARLRGEALAKKAPLTGEEFRRLLAESEQQASPTGTKRIECKKTLQDLVLPPEQKAQFARICAFGKIRPKVYREWNFQEKVAYGKGMSALLYGASGTGKTMAATVLAAELGLPLYRVDLAQIISKYIGETQKSIGLVFDEAASRDCILFFDEADSLFARRSEMADSQDKYSNAEIAYLLQRMEEHDGISILATNLLQNFDEAFRRRISYMIHFPLPDMALRLELWRGIFPAQAPLEEIDYELLAREFELSGAAIKNCALHAAYAAALEGTAIAMPHIIDAVRSEYGKTGKNISMHTLQMLNCHL